MVCVTCTPPTRLFYVYQTSYAAAWHQQIDEEYPPMFNAFRKKYDRTTPDVQDRVPPGQYLTEKFPVLHYGSVPQYHDLEHTWDLRVWGEIEQPARFSFSEFRALPTIHVTTDIHCVTRWSKLDTQWDGVQ